MGTKKITLGIVIIITLLISCNNDEEIVPITLKGAWSVKNISGGFAGIDDDFTQGTIVWSFGEQTLTVENNNTSTTVYQGLDAGSYTYTIIENEGDSYLVIDEAEIGKYILTSTNLLINQNEFSTGNGSDGFIIALER